MKKIASIIILIIIASVQLNGKLRLPSLLGDNMVLQQNTKVKLWGWSEPGERITISTTWSRRTVATTADSCGNWSIYIKTPEHCSGQGMEILSANTKELIKIENILIGEVWLASGQSNMEFEMKPNSKEKWMTGMYNWEREAADAHYPNIHLFKVEKAWEHGEPRSHCKGEWVVCTPEAAESFSAIAFLFARELHTTLQRPVGIILCAFGGTHAESWIRKEVMQDKSIYNGVFEKYTPDKMEPKGYQHKVPSAIWNAMVNPIVGYTVKGNIWYQAESNSYRAKDYAPIFFDLVNDWRELWQQKRLPFYIMQVAPYASLPGKIREEQVKVWKEAGSMSEKSLHLKDICFATTIDTGDSLDVHPKEKLIPAQRFAKLALAKEYGVKVESCGPLLKKIESNGNTLVISFRNGKGLHVTDDSGAEKTTGVRYLSVAADDGIFYPALSRIIGNKLIVWSPEVNAPKYVKYSTQDYCKGNIYNGAGLPAFPFNANISTL